MRRSAPLALVIAVVMLAGCGGGTGPAIQRPVPPVTGEPLIYVAIGASETAGVGTRDPFTDAWPKVLWRETLPAAVLYDLGRPGSTLGEAIDDQLDPAVALDPDVVTVWLNVNDLIAGVPVQTFRQELADLLSALTASGATVLVANTPRLDTLPVYLACLPDPPVGAPACPAAGLPLPPPAQVRSAVTAYNEAIQEIAARTGAVVVDLQAYGDAPSTHPEWIAEDGFHPSSAGARAIAEVFAAAVPDDILAAAANG